MNFEQYLKQELENDSVLRDEFNALQPEYELISQHIKSKQQQIEQLRNRKWWHLLFKK